MNPVEIAILARLLVPARKPPSEDEVLKSLRLLFDDVSDVDSRLRSALDRLAREGLRVDGEMRLTAKGKREAETRLGIAAGTKPTWPRLKSRLVEVALGRAPSPHGRPLGAGAIRAAALASKLGIETQSTKPGEVLDALAARELGMSGRRLSVVNVRAFALSRALGIDSPRDPKRIGTIATAHILDVPRSDAGLVRDAVLRDWLGSTSSKQTKQIPEVTDLHTFAATVKELARKAEDGRFGRHKVFIAPIWKRARASFRSMDESEFKTKLVDAHRAGLLQLARADLTPAMARDVVEASEVPYLNAVFHFVDLEGSLS